MATEQGLAGRVVVLPRFSDSTFPMFLLAAAIALTVSQGSMPPMALSPSQATTFRPVNQHGGVLHGRTLGPAGVRVATAPVATPWPGAGTAFGPGCSPFLNGGFEFDLQGWNAFASTGGSPAGSVGALNGAAVLAEGGSFLTTLSQSICFDAEAQTLRFELVGTSFDLAADQIPDAFEVSLLDASFQSVVPTWSTAATSYFNVQEDGTVFAAPGVSVTGNVVSVDLVGAPRFTDLLLTVNLVGADADALSEVTVDNIHIDSGEPGVSFCEGIDCPCGNDSPGTGCLNTLGTGGLLGSSGTASLTMDDLIFHAEGLTPTFAMLIAGSSETCVLAGDGRLAMAPGIGQPGVVRIIVSNSHPTGDLTIGPGIPALIDQVTGTTGMIQPGTTWFFQVVYRDAPTSPCGQLFNFTNGLRVTFSN